MQAPKKHEESIGVKLPDGRRYMVQVMVGALETDEEVLRRVSTSVGTEFNVTGTRYKVVSRDPFKIRKIADNGRSVSDAPSEGDDESPKSERRVSSSVTPQIGERWRPKDPRRKASFTVVDIVGDHAITDDGRRIQLARFRRYEKLNQPAA